MPQTSGTNSLAYRPPPDGAQPSWYLMDASIYIFRSYFSLPDHWHTAEGLSTQAVYGYLNTLLKLLEVAEPRQLAVAFDESLHSGFRHRLYPDYKANRALPDDALAFQLEACQQVTELLGITQFASTEFEADDIIASLAACAKTHGKNTERKVVVLSGDKDLCQVIGKSDWLWDFGRKAPMDTTALQQQFGVSPQQFTDYLALRGDTVDGIPGVPGVGEKTAATLLQHFANLDAIFDNLSAVATLPLRGAATLPDKLSRYREQAMISKVLATAITDIDLELDSEGIPWPNTPPNVDAILAFCRSMGFESDGHHGAVPAPKGIGQRVVRCLHRLSSQK